MKQFAFIFVSLFIFNADASEASKASTVLNHLMSVGRNDQGFQTLPENTVLGDWKFEKISAKYYQVIGPRSSSLHKRIYEYTIENDEVQSIGMAGGHEAKILYKRDACVEFYKKSLEIKSEEELQRILTELFKKYKVQGADRKPGDEPYARGYAKNCKFIFKLDEEKAIREIVKQRKTSK